jgi:hypothetical protein
MTAVSGQLTVGEARHAVRAVAARQRGPAYLYYAMMIAMGAAGAAAGAVVDHVFQRSRNGLGMPLGTCVGLILYVLFARRITISRFRSRLAARGVPLDMPLQLEITGDGLIYTVGAVEQKAPWSVVTEVFRSRGYWIFMVQASPWFLPERFFADAQSERAFLKSALDRMSEGARSRSREAVAFAQA